MGIEDVIDDMTDSASSLRSIAKTLETAAKQVKKAQDESADLWLLLHQVYEGTVKVKGVEYPVSLPDAVKKVMETRLFGG